MTDYKKKYIKYKIKYLNLIGGNYKYFDNMYTNILNKLCVKDKKEKYITETDCVTSKECTYKLTHSQTNNIIWLTHLLTIIRNDPTYYKIDTIKITPYYKLELNINNNIITANFNDNLLEHNITYLINGMLINYIQI